MYVLPTYTCSTRMHRPRPSILSSQKSTETISAYSCKKFLFFLHGRYLLAISNPKNAAAFAGKARNMQGAKPTNSPLQPSVVRMCRNVEDIPRYMLPSDEAIIRFFTTSKG